MANFEEILSRPASENRPPEAYPAGRYHCIVDGPPEQGKSSQKQTDYLRFKFKIINPDRGVDARKATEMQLQGKIITNDYYITDGAAYRLNDFFTSIGIENPDGSRSAKEMLMEAPGKQLYVTLKHDISPDGKRVYHKVESTEAV